MMLADPVLHIRTAGLIIGYSQRRVWMQSFCQCLSGPTIVTPLFGRGALCSKLPLLGSTSRTR